MVIAVPTASAAAPATIAVSWLAAEPGPVTSTVTARLASAPDEAAAKIPARPRGRMSCPIAANATTSVPPAIALMATMSSGLTCFPSP